MVLTEINYTSCSIRVRFMHNQRQCHLIPCAYIREGDRIFCPSNRKYGIVKGFLRYGLANLPIHVVEFEVENDRLSLSNRTTCTLHKLTFTENDINFWLSE